MKTRLLATLETVMVKWMADSCESEEWPEEYFGNDTARLMTRAASSVFDAVVEVQQFGITQGYLERIE